MTFASGTNAILHVTKMLLELVPDGTVLMRFCVKHHYCEESEHKARNRTYSCAFQDSAHQKKFY